MLHLPEGGVVAAAHQVHAAEAHVIEVVQDVEEGDHAGPALRGVQPVAGPGILADVRLAAIPDVEAVERVIEQGQEDEAPLQHANERQAGEELDLVVVGLRALGRLGVGDEVLEQECADGNDAGQRVQPAQQERVALAGAERRNSLGNCRQCLYR